MTTDHPRALIRDHIAAGLVAASTIAGPQVYANRIEPVGDNWTPAIYIHTPDELIDQKDSWVASDPDSPGRLTREMVLAIAGIVEMQRPGVPIDRVLDRLASQIEAFMDSDPTLGGRVSKSLLQRTTQTLKPGGLEAIAMVQLLYTVTYYTQTNVAVPPEGSLPVEVFGGIAPNIGQAHKDDYFELAER